MAKKPQCGHLTESSKHYITSTPCVPSSTGDNEENCYSSPAVDSGYFTLSKHTVSNLSVAALHGGFPPLNLDITEDNVRPVCDADCIDQSPVDVSEYRKNLNHRCQSRMSDVTDIQSTSDVVDWLTISVDSASERHSLDDSIHEEHSITTQQRTDIISQLLPCFPHIVARILCHVADSDLCRYWHISDIS